MSYHEEEELLEHRQERGTPGVLRISAIERGWGVYDRDGEKVGDVDKVEAGTVVVEKGFISKHHLYIPYAAIVSLDSDRLNLSVRKDEIDDLGWEHRLPKDTGFARPPHREVVAAREGGAEPGTVETPELLAIGTEYSTTVPDVESEREVDVHVETQYTPVGSEQLPPDIALETNRNPLETMYGRDVPPPVQSNHGLPGDIDESIDHPHVDEAASEGTDVGSTGAGTASDPYGSKAPDAGR